MSSTSIARLNNKNKTFHRGLTSWERNSFAAKQVVAILKGLHRRRPTHYNDVLIAVRSAVDANTLLLNSPLDEFQFIDPSELIELKINGGSDCLESLSCPKVQMAVTAFQENPECQAFVFIGSNTSEAFSLLGNELDPVSRDAALWFGKQANLDSIFQSEGESGANFRRLISQFPYMIVRSEGVCVCESSLDRALAIALAGDNACRLQLATSHVAKIQLIPEGEIPSIRAFEMNTSLLEQKMSRLSGHL